MARRQLIAGNWKMHTTRSDAIALIQAISAGQTRRDLDVAVFPPSIWLCDVAATAAGSLVSVGAQNCWITPSGAYTGELSTAMIAEVARLVLVGHSERRQLIGETDHLVRKKLDSALQAGLTPILCVGESLDTRRAGDAVPFVRQQITTALAGRPHEELDKLVVAYEPVWAIGTGVAATAGDAQAMCSEIRGAINSVSRTAGDTVRVLYGGSVNPANAAELLARPDIDGALVGGASLKPADFLAIIATTPHRD